MGADAYSRDSASPVSSVSKRNEQYDISFAYSFNWGVSAARMTEALKILLFNGLAEAAQPDLTPQEKIRKQAAQEESARIRWLLAINPNTPPPVLEHLSKDTSVHLLERIAENPRTHVTTLIRLSAHEEPQVRASCAENANLTLRAIWRLARDVSADVRLRLAESYTVPIAVLRVLAEDQNPYVAERAQRTMRRIMEEVHGMRRANA